MSIVALKRKTEAKYNNNSVNQISGFSLNGTRRNQGYIGQTSLSRSLSRTLMKGTAVKGHGGCCGTYTYGPVVRSASSLCLEDSSVVKGSVLSSKGMLKERFVCDDNCNSVKPDANNNLNNHSDVIRRRAKACINTSDSNYQPKMPSDISTSCKKACVYAKPESTYVAMPGSDYLRKLNKRCSENDVKYVASNVKRTPFGISS